MFKIDKDIPLPERIRGKEKKYPWSDMQVGDSFLIPDTTRSSGTAYAQKRYGIKLAIRKTPEGTRIWRIA